MSKATTLPVLVERYRTEESKQTCDLLRCCRHPCLMPLVVVAHYRRLLRTHRKGTGRHGLKGTSALRRLILLEVAASRAREAEHGQK